MAQARIDGVEDDLLGGVGAFFDLGGEGADEKDFEEFGGRVAFGDVSFFVLVEGIEDDWFFTLGETGLEDNMVSFGFLHFRIGEDIGTQA